jgi:hypothetical protein
MEKRHLAFGVLMVAVLMVPHATHADFRGPLPYLSFSDSPFCGLTFDYFYLEDFKDGILNTPGVTASQGVVSDRTVYTDSVDADDGLMNNNGNVGGSFFIANNLGVTFTFSDTVLGRYPTHAGIVWTDSDFPRGATYVNLEAFDSSGSSLGALGRSRVGDGSVTGTTAEDRFLGVFNNTGISAIRIYNDATQMEVDHLQYGCEAVPLPGAFFLGGIGLTFAGWLRRRWMV